VQRAEDKTAQMQARSGAIDELIASGALDDVSAINRGDDISRELDALSSGSDVESELAALKAGTSGGTPTLQSVETTPAQIEAGQGQAGEGQAGQRGATPVAEPHREGDQP
jgi:phage shock protein A